MIKKKTMYEASDGTLLPSRDAAQTYNDMIDLYDYVDRHPISVYDHPSVDGVVDGAALQVWLRANPCIFMIYLHGGETPQGQDDVETSYHPDGLD